MLSAEGELLWVRGRLTVLRIGQWKDVQGFLGLTGYYRRFIMRYGEIAQPSTALLKKDGWNWTEKATHAFQELK